jgi:hypothetical protein
MSAANAIHGCCLSRAQLVFRLRPSRVTSGGLGPLRRQVDPSQRTPPAARMASGSGQGTKSLPR